MAAKCSLSFLLNNNNEENNSNSEDSFVPSFSSKENNSHPIPSYDATCVSTTKTWTEENLRSFPQQALQQLPQQMLQQLCMHLQMSGTFNPPTSIPQPQQLHQLQVLQALHMYLQPKPGQESDEKIVSQKDSNQILREKISSSRKRKRQITNANAVQESKKKKKQEEEKKQSEGEDSQKESDEDEEEEEMKIAENEHEEDEHEEEEEEGTKKEKRSGSGRGKEKGMNGEEKRSGLAPTQQRKRATPFQAAYLEYAFRLNPRPDATAKYHISQHINMSTQRISIWFQNKRARMKRSKNPAPSLSDLKGSVVDHSVPPVEHMFANK